LRTQPYIIFIVDFAGFVGGAGETAGRRYPGIASTFSFVRLTVRTYPKMVERGDGRQDAVQNDQARVDKSLISLEAGLIITTSSTSFILPLSVYNPDPLKPTITYIPPSTCSDHSFQGPSMPLATGPWL
jgi:hypothetical protein